MIIMIFFEQLLLLW